jgi:hypothetical protein
MKRIFAKCFLQKHSQNTKVNKNQQSVLKESIHEEDNENKEPRENNINAHATNHIKSITESDNLEQNRLNKADITCSHETKDYLTPQQGRKNVQQNQQQQKKISDSQRSIKLRSLKPDLLPHGSPARKRVRSNRSNSRTLSFICLDSAEHSDDDENIESFDLKGKIDFFGQ